MQESGHHSLLNPQSQGKQSQVSHLDIKNTNSRVLQHQEDKPNLEQHSNQMQDEYKNEFEEPDNLQLKVSHLQQDLQNQSPSNDQKRQIFETNTINYEQMSKVNKEKLDNDQNQKNVNQKSFRNDNPEINEFLNANSQLSKDNSSQSQFHKTPLSNSNTHQIKQNIKKEHKPSLSENVNKVKNDDNFWYEQLNIPDHGDYQAYQQLKQMIQIEELQLPNGLKKQKNQKIQYPIIKGVEKEKNKKQILSNIHQRKNGQKPVVVSDLWTSLRKQIEQQQKKIELNQSPPLKNIKVSQSLKKVNKKNDKQVKKQTQQKHQQKSHLENELLKQKSQVVEKVNAQHYSEKKILQDKVKQWSKANKQFSIKRKAFAQKKQYQKWAEENAQKETEKLRIQEQKRDRAKAAQERLEHVKILKSKQQQNSRVKSGIKQHSSIMDYLSGEEKKQNQVKSEKKKKPRKIKNQKQLDNSYSVVKLKKPHRKASDQNLKLKINQEPNFQKRMKSVEIQPLKNSLGDYDNFLEYKKSVEIHCSDKQKLRRRRIFNNRVRQIPINMSQHKKKQLMVGIDKAMSPLKYQLLSRKGLSDIEIYQSSKQFQVSASEQRNMGKQYLNQLRIKNQGNQMKLHRAIQSSPLKSSQKVQNKNKIFVYESDLVNLQDRIRKQKQSLTQFVVKNKSSKQSKDANQDLQYMKSLGI